MTQAGVSPKRPMDVKSSTYKINFTTPPKELSVNVVIDVVGDTNHKISKKLMLG